MIVDDGSTDGTRELAASDLPRGPPIAAGRHAEAATGALSDGRREGRDLLAFQHGVRSLPEPVDVVVKLDADLSFEPGLLRPADRRVRRTTRRLGIAGGACHELEDGEWVRRKVVPTAVWGASRAYRCGVPRRGHGPGAARRLGRHRRDQGAAPRLPHRHRARPAVPPPPARGRSARRPACTRTRSPGAPPGTWATARATSFLRSLYRARRDRAALGLLWGYANAAVEPRAALPGARRDRRTALATAAVRGAARRRPRITGS